ncbi:hypothetical protein M404DRAFT_98925, partial [Pisolithus tinctorius Marx 270]
DDEYLRLPSEKDVRTRVAAFIQATGNGTLRRCVCVVCARELMINEGKEELIENIPNIQVHLRPEVVHPAYDLWQGLLLLKHEVDDTGKGWVCWECYRALRANKMPKLALNNNMWLGDPPLELRRLTFAETLLVARHYPRCYVFKLYPRDGSRGYNPAHLQRGMAGNMTLYEVNTTAMASMLEGSLMPQHVTTLSSVLAITFIGTRSLLKNWLSRTFRVRREAVHEALQWLKQNNPLYHDITISEQRLMTLPDDEVPEEIEAIIRREDDGEIALQERDGYVLDAIQDEICKSQLKENHIEADVVPLHALGITDSDLSRVSSSELMSYALANLMDVSQEGGYVVRHGLKAIGDFGKDASERGTPNPLAAAFPCLFPYGGGGIEADRATNVSLREHVRWAMQYYDRRFVSHHAFPFVVFAMIQKRDTMRSARLQMRRKDFERDALAFNPRVRALHKHVVTANSKVEGSDNARAQYRGMIWGSCLFLGGPTIWMTINPADMHDPIAQVLAGEIIDLDRFDALAGPDSHQRATNIAGNPYAAAKFFNFLIETMLETLLGITKRASRSCSDMGILGRLSGYFGVVEAQGR